MLFWARIVVDEFDGSLYLLFFFFVPHFAEFLLDMTIQKKKKVSSIHALHVLIESVYN